MDLHQHIIITPSLQFTLGFTLGVAHSVGLDRCIVTYIHYYIRQNKFTTSKNSLWSTYSSLHLLKPSLPRKKTYLFLAMPTAHGILAHHPGIKTMTPALEVCSFNHWTAREVPPIPF